MLLFLFVAPVLLFTSCTKSINEPGRSYSTDITGSWYLAEAAESAGNGWNVFSTGLEKGTFTFFGDGSARYDDGYNKMTGTWTIVTLSDGYYDRYGVFHSELHDSFRLHLRDSYTNNSVDLYFDDIIVASGNLIGTSYNGHTVNRYIFNRL